MGPPIKAISTFFLLPKENPFTQEINPFPFSLSWWCGSSLSVWRWRIKFMETGKLWGTRGLLSWTNHWAVLCSGCAAYSRHVEIYLLSSILEPRCDNGSGMRYLWIWGSFWVFCWGQQQQRRRTTVSRSLTEWEDPGISGHLSKGRILPELWYLHKRQLLIMAIFQSPFFFVKYIFIWTPSAMIVLWW